MAFTFLKFLIRDANPLHTGALNDPRPQEEKNEDVHFNELVATANAVNWVTKDTSTWRSFPVLDQHSSYMCGANSLSKAWGIYLSQKYGKYVQLSRAHIYQRRANRPTGGMALYDMFNILTQGATLEQLTNENISTDEQADSTIVDSLEKEVGKGFATTGGVYAGNDIDTIASIISTTGKGVILQTFFTSGEWSKTFPTITYPYLTNSDPSALRHFVVAVDYTLLNGVKCLVVEDSAAFGGIYRRIVSEAWMKARVVASGYPMTFKFSIQSTQPSFDGISNISAQTCLQAGGFFPTNVAFSSNWGAVSTASAKKFQAKYGLPITGLLDLTTRNKLLQLYP